MDFFMARSVLPQVAVLTAVILVVRPWIYRVMFRKTGEKEAFAKETGIRLGQASEFSLIIAVVAESSGRIQAEVSQLIQMTAIFTMMLSSYYVVFTCPTPIGTSKKLKKD